MTVDTAGLIRDMNALVAAGANHDTTIKGTQRPVAPSAPTGPAPKGWEPGVQFRDDGGMTVTTPPTRMNLQRDEGAWTAFVQESMDLELPPGYVAILKEAKFDPGAWGRETQFVEWPDADEREAAGKSRYTKTPATRDPVWRYRFSIELASEQVHREDVDRIIAEAMRKRRKRPAAAVDVGRRSLNVVYADPQAGKVALLGGTSELAARIGSCFDQLTDHIRDIKKIGRGPTEAAWLDAGDCIEGQQNVRSQAYTNDLTMTQMVRAHRRLTFHGLDYLADRFTDVQALTCGSNHARVRDGKDPLGPPDDDWGIEVLSQVQDAYRRNPDAYGHVRFGYPPDWRDTLCADLGGLPVGLAHGHQFNKPEAVTNWWKGQVFGNQPVTHARILVTGHFHHLAMKECGDGRLAVQAPTLDPGSDWYTMRSGEVSQPGLLVFSTTENGWDDLRILRPTEGIDPKAWGR